MGEEIIKRYFSKIKQIPNKISKKEKNNLLNKFLREFYREINNTELSTDEALGKIYENE